MNRRFLLIILGFDLIVVLLVVAYFLSRNGGEDGPAGGDGEVVLRYTFTPEELVAYRFDGEITEKSDTPEAESRLFLEVGCDFDVFTAPGSAAGNAELRAVIEALTVTGTAMGDPIEVRFGEGQFQTFDYPGGTGEASAEALVAVRDARVARVTNRGQVLEYPRNSGIGAVLGSLPLIGLPLLPEGGLEPGATWNAQMGLIAAGVPAAFDPVVASTFAGDEPMGGRACAHMSEAFSSGADGAPGKIGGRGDLYFETAAGKLAHHSIEWDVHLVLPEIPENGADLLSMLRYAPNDDGPIEAEGEGGTGGQGITLHISGAVTRIDPQQLVTAPE